MSEMHIEKLALKLTGMDHRQAKRLAEQVATGLERMSFADDLPSHVKLVVVRLHNAGGDNTEQLAAKVLVQLMRELRRS